MMKWVLYADTAEELRQAFVQYLREQSMRRAETHKRTQRDQAIQKAQAAELASLAVWLSDLEIKPNAENQWKKSFLVDLPKEGA